MHELKPITPAGIAAALQKANRYRLLNDSAAAESICLDILAVDPGNVDAGVTHVLAITDQFPESGGEGLARAQQAVERLHDRYRNAYYNGIICERWAKALLRRGVPGTGHLAWDWIARALAHYEAAEALRPAGNDEAILRWNTCVRLLRHDASVRPRDAEEYEPSFE